MDQLDQDLTRFKNPAMAAVGGIAAALVIATLPPVYLENIIGLTGISEIIPAAAPPLGNTAKALISITAGLVTTSALFIFLNRKGGSDMGLAIRANLTTEEASTEEGVKSGLSLSKFSLKKLLQKPAKKGQGQKAKVMDLSDLPKLREADSHPDAPARKPIFADSDLGTPLAGQIKPFAEPVEKESKATTPEVTPASFVAEKSLQMPAEEAALDLSRNIFAETEEQPVEPVVQETAPIIQQSAPVVQETVPVADPVAAVPKEDMSGLSIAQLAERLETGLERLKQLEIAHRTGVVPAQTATHAPAGGPPAGFAEAPLNVPPLKPVEQTEEDPQAARQADMDAALKAALGTLEKMTAQR